MTRKHRKVSEQLRAAIKASDRSRYRLALEAEIDQSSLSRFMNYKTGLSMEAMDRLAEVLELELVARQKATKKRKKGG